MKRSLFSVLGFVLGMTLVFGGTAAAHTRAGTLALQGSVLFSTSNGELYNDENRTQLALQPSIHYFVIDRFALGGRLGVETVKQGDFSSTSFLIGPSASYYFGDMDESMIPYVGAGFFYRAISSETELPNGLKLETDDSGTSIALFGGLAFFLRDNLALTPELSINLESLGGNSGTTFQVGIGLAGFLY